MVLSQPVSSSRVQQRLRVPTSHQGSCAAPKGSKDGGLGQADLLLLEGSVGCLSQIHNAVEDKPSPGSAPV